MQTQEQPPSNKKIFKIKNPDTGDAVISDAKSFTERARHRRGASLAREAERQKLWKKKQEVFEKARTTAAKIVWEQALYMSSEQLEEIWKENATTYRNKGQIKWNHDLRHASEDIISLPEDIEIPMKKDKTTGENKPICFRASVFFQNDDFKAQCASHYNKFNLAFSVSPDRHHRGVWWVVLQEKEGLQVIFPKELEE